MATRLSHPRGGMTVLAVRDELRMSASGRIRALSASEGFDDNRQPPCEPLAGAQGSVFCRRFGHARPGGDGVHDRIGGLEFAGEAQTRGMARQSPVSELAGANSWGSDSPNQASPVFRTRGLQP